MEEGAGAATASSNAASAADAAATAALNAAILGDEGEPALADGDVTAPNNGGAFEDDDDDNDDDDDDDDEEDDDEDDDDDDDDEDDDDEEDDEDGEGDADGDNDDDDDDDDENNEDNVDDDAAGDENVGVSEYEKQRMERMAENEQMLTGLGLIREGQLKSPAEIAARDAQRLKRKRKQRLHQLMTAGASKKAKPSRASRRLRGDDVEDGESAGTNGAGASASAKAPDSESEADESAGLVDRWKLHVEDVEADKELDDDDGQRRLFLIPTGVDGVNDHTLDDPVAAIGSHLWGFCEGLFSRIFIHVRPGDIFLMTTSGCGLFNRIARVKEKRIVDKKLADTFWQRLQYTMGGACRQNVGFPLLTPLDAPQGIDWDKMEVMKLFGYNDHLQSSRWIKSEKLATANGKLVYQRCLAKLGLTAKLTDAEKAMANKLVDTPLPRGVRRTPNDEAKDGAAAKKGETIAKEEPQPLPAVKTQEEAAAAKPLPAAPRPKSKSKAKIKTKHATKVAAKPKGKGKAAPKPKGKGKAVATPKPKAAASKKKKKKKPARALEGRKTGAAVGLEIMSNQDRRVDRARRHAQRTSLLEHY